MRKYKLLALVVSGVLVDLYSRTAFALDMEYHTYGGFNAILIAWQQTAMVFNNASYSALFYTIIFAAIIFGAMSAYYKLFQGANANPLAWTVPVLFGVIIYMGLFIPKGTLYIYDDVLNKNQNVSGIPDAIIFLAGVSNGIERGMVEIIQTSGAPLSYQEAAGGIGFDTLLKATSYIPMDNTYIDASLEHYIKDCLYFELNRPGTALTVDAINNNNGNLLTLFGYAANPAIFTVWYDASNQAGTTMSCFGSSNNIAAWFGDNNNMQSIVNAKCASAGFDPTDSAQILQCKQLLSDTVTFTAGATNTVSAEQFFQQAVLAQRIASAASGGTVDQAILMKGNSSTMTALYGVGVMANEWIPVIRAVITAVAIGLLPVLVIFIPTGVGNKALAMISGFFIWLCNLGRCGRYYPSNCDQLCLHVLRTGQTE